MLPPISVYESYFAHCRGERYRLEASPAYSYRAEAVRAAIKAALPRARIILALRPPRSALVRLHLPEEHGATARGRDL